MTIPRFFIPTNAVDRQNERVLHKDAALTKQLTKVLRLKPGAKVDFLDGTGHIYHCQLTSCEKDTAIASIQSTALACESARVRVNVALPPLKSDRFEWALEKLTELGVAQIVPIVVTRSVVKPAQSQLAFSGKAEQLESVNQRASSLSGAAPQEFSAKLTRWQSIVKEASEQSERAVLPQLVPPLSFADFLRLEQNIRPNSLRFICAERSSVDFFDDTLCNRLRQHSHPLEDITIAVGAEGGFTEDELEAAHEAGFLPVSLGKLILRAETAAIYALAIVASRRIDAT